MPPSDRRPSRQRTNKDPIAGELGAAQAEIMNLIWDRQGATVPEIHAAINTQRKTGVAYTTVLTLVQRLYARNLLVREPEGRTFRYRAAQSRDELIAAWSDEMIDLTILVGGSQRRIPAGVGIGVPRNRQATPVGTFVAGASCFSWLHTHAADGIVHIESPVRRAYTLGNFLDVWRQPLGPSRLGSATGHVTAFLDGRSYHGNPRDIPLTAHAQIQVGIGRSTVGPESIRFPPGL